MLKISEVQMKWSGAAMWDNGGGLEFVKSKNSHFKLHSQQQQEFVTQQQTTIIYMYPGTFPFK